MPWGQALYNAGDVSSTPLSRQFTSRADTEAAVICHCRINKVHKLVDVCKQMSSKHLSAMEMEGQSGELNQSTCCIRIKTCRDSTLQYIILMYALLHTACQCDLCTTQVQIVYKLLIHGCDFPWTLNTVIKHSVLHEELIRNASKIFWQFIYPLTTVSFVHWSTN